MSNTHNIVQEIRPNRSSGKADTRELFTQPYGGLARRSGAGHGSWMSDVVEARPGSASWRLRLLRVFLALLLVTPVLALVLVFDISPRVADAGPPDAAAARLTGDVAARLQGLVATQAADDYISFGEAEINAVLAAAQRMRPGLFGRAMVHNDGVELDVSVGAPVLPGWLWLNLRAVLAPSENGLRIASARLGDLPVPPALADRALKFGLARVLGDPLGLQAVDSVAALRLDPPDISVVFDFDRIGREAFFARLRARALDGAGETAREQVYVQVWRFDRAVQEGRLPRSGSVLPYLTHAVRTASRQTDTDAREAIRGALYALALYCGDPGFGDQIGVTLRPELPGRANGCEGTRLRGRDDLKRHFVISAGLYAATAGDSAFGMGELKELLDSNDGGSGFSFADMAADVAGVRFAQALLDSGRDAWPDLLSAIDNDADLLPSLDGLPEGLSEAEFRAAYRDVDSAEYAAMVEEIRRRVDVLPFYSVAVGN
jgi:hypothetical protein